MSRYEPDETTQVDADLADRLLRHGSSEHTPTTGTAPAGDQGDVAPYEDDYLATPPRSRLTTALVVALIFLVGALVGTALTRALSPAPAPQIVYVLNTPSPSPGTR